MLRMHGPKQSTFWASLSQAEREGSVQQKASRKLGDDTAWSPAGCVEGKWNAEIKSMVGCLLQHNEKRIFKGLRVKKRYAFHCWMVGSTANNCHPTVVVISTMAQVARQAAEVIDESRVLERFGFCCRWFKATIKQPAGDSEIIDRSEGLCGAPIYIRKKSSVAFAPTRRATMGGIVTISAINYGLTVAHTFLPDESELDELTRELELGEELQVHSSLEHVEDDGFGSSANESVADDFRVYLALSSGFIGPLSRTGNPDWALVEIQNPDIPISNSILLPDSGICYPGRSTSEVVSTDVWVATGTSGVRKAFVSGATCGLYLPESGLQDSFALDLAIGDYSFAPKFLRMLTNSQNPEIAGLGFWTHPIVVYREQSLLHAIFSTLLICYRHQVSFEVSSQFSHRIL